ncbi:hypothetical protein AERO8C_70675 [Aeromonas veronii]|uniref:Uncharacterized protein n=1 Tax=Aeromonas veronii TaxID=654 RepID=A0A653LBV5_AERVE|nr:hypothetical protein AERO8C_70675 [Aeromonas veronii]
MAGLERREVAGAHVDGVIGAAWQIELPARIGEGAQFGLDKLDGEAQGLQAVDAVDKGFVAQPRQLHLAAPVTAGGLGIRLGGLDGDLEGELFPFGTDSVEAGGNDGVFHLAIPFPWYSPCGCGGAGVPDG